MLTIAYLANEFPAAVEPYVAEEVRELRQRRLRIVTGSVQCPRVITKEYQGLAAETLYVRPLKFMVLVRAAWMCLKGRHILLNFCRAAFSEINEPFHRRIRAIAHTGLGVCYAAMLSEFTPEHIHVHHGYYAAWVAMVAARLLGISYSMTLHGSDLLLHHAFLNLKLTNCKFCLTVSEFNRQHILKTYCGIQPEKIRVQRIGVPTFIPDVELEKPVRPNAALIMLSVGRLHQVKDHAFLLRACSALKARGFHFACLIAGEGPERSNLERFICELDLKYQVTLLGHVPRARLENYYAVCDLVVLTSKSEGVPLTLMEAMAHRRTVLAPAITGIPELVVDGQTGFLYQPGSINDFVAKVEAIRAGTNVSTVRDRARRHVLQHFDQATNLAEFAESFPALVMERAA